MSRKLEIYSISAECVGCTLCSKKCPAKAIAGDKKARHVIDQLKCEGCGTCFKGCPRGAIYDSAGRNNGKSVKKNKKLVSSIDLSICVGCRNCLPQCTEAFAITYQKRLFSSNCVINEAVCIGCRSCVNSCPNSAIQMKEVDR